MMRITAPSTPWMRRRSWLARRERCRWPSSARGEQPEFDNTLLKARFKRCVPLPAVTKPGRQHCHMLRAKACRCDLTGNCSPPLRAQQTKERQLLTQNSLQPRNFLTEVQDWKQYYTADWTPDRGSSVHENERRRLRRPALVQTGRCVNVDAAARFGFTGPASLAVVAV